jgi:hypothetical protein
LNGNLDEEIYMEQPEGFSKKGQEYQVCKLSKSLYGLKQAGCSWYHMIDGHLADIGFSRTHADNCVYHYQRDGVIMILALYVDDLIMLSNDLEALNNLKKKLSERFEMKDLGEAHYVLGIQIIRDRSSKMIRINQTNYIENILKKFNMADCKTIGAPTDINVKLSTSQSPQSDEERAEMVKIPYQNAIGSLMYAMIGTRPDIAYSVGVLSKYNANPGKAHWQAVKRVFRYLQGTKNHSLEYRQTGKSLIGYCDADWAGDSDDRKSTTGYAFILAGGAVTWSSKKQPTVALSTTEAEYMAITQATKEAIWLQSLLEQLDFRKSKEVTTIYDDNQGCVALTKNSVHHARTKHIDIQHHFVREKVENKEVTIEYCDTNNMTADILTKGLAKEKHKRFSEGMGLKCG